MYFPSLILVMANKNYQKPSPQTQEEAMRIARATQRPAQTKEQTKLIVQGIQKGIEQYKKHQKEKSRELNRQRKKVAQRSGPQAEHAENGPPIQEMIVYRQHWLPWLLLGLTWLGIGIYQLMR
jgi:hypothetical protein